MPKIKNWKIERKDEEATMWRHSNGDLVGVKRYYPMSREYSFFEGGKIPSWELHNIPSSNKYFTSRAEAEKEAVDWMKDNVMNTKTWEVEWDDGYKDYIESDERPDEENIESGIDADSGRWGHTVKKIMRVNEIVKNRCIHCGKIIDEDNEICEKCFLARTRGEV